MALLTYGTVNDKCAGPHAVKGAVGGPLVSASFCHDANGNQVFAKYEGGRTREIDYFSYDLASEIRDKSNVTSLITNRNTIIRFEYTTGRGLWRRHDIIPCAGGTFCVGGPVESATYFIGNVEIRKQNWGSPQRKRYIGGYLVITEQAASVKYQYLFKDVLGSLDAAVDPAQINVVERYSFDAWGNRRRAETASPSNLWTGLTPAEIAAQYGTVDSTTRQDYTGHEMLDRVGLIHMNARLYDPLLGRFIQADTMVEDDATQGLNRYSYCLTNPLSRTDPSGNLSFRQILGLAVGVAFAIISQQYWAANALWASFAAAVGGGFASAYIATGSLKAGLWGALSAAVFWGIGTGFSKTGTESAGSFSPGNAVKTVRSASGSTVAKVAAHAAAGGTLNMLQGGKFGHGFLSAGVTEALSPAIGAIGGGKGSGAVVGGTIASAVVGGTVSELSGGKFGNGAQTGAFQFLFNKTVHVFKDGFESEATKTRERIAELAMGSIGSERWAYDVANGPYGPQTNKCNLFIHDILSMAGAGNPYRNGGRLYNWFGIGSPKYPILAGQWADPGYSIPGWDVVSTPAPGDIAAVAHDYADATGHVGIVVRGLGGGLGTVSQPSFQDPVARSLWGFRRNEPTPTFRRYRGN